MNFRLSKFLMAGGLTAAIALGSVALHAWWPLALLAFGLLGLLHGSIQVFMTELAPEARGSAAALHSSSFFLGQAIGPVVYGLGLAWAGQGPTLVIAAIGVALVALVAVRLLHATGPT